MKARQRFNSKNDGIIETGNVLLSKAFWNSDAYQHSVILVTEHDKYGSAGVILNKRSNLNLSDVVSSITEKIPLYFGGPSDLNSLSCLHSYPGIPESIEVAEDIYWGGDLNQIIELFDIEMAKASQFNFCMGRVVWSAGQLEDELENDKWWVSEIKSKELFNQNLDYLWNTKLEEDKHLYSLVSDLPDPSSN